MKRFADIAEEHHAPLMQKRSGLDGWGDNCSLCGVAFDPADAKIWTRETGKAHYRCYAEWRQKQK